METLHVQVYTETLTTACTILTGGYNLIFHTRGMIIFGYHSSLSYTTLIHPSSNSNLTCEDILYKTTAILEWSLSGDNSC